MVPKFKVNEVLVLKHKPTVNIRVVGILDDFYLFHMEFLDDPTKYRPHKLLIQDVEANFRLQTDADVLLYHSKKSQ